MSLAGMVTRRIRKLIAWLIALAVIVLVVAGALALAGVELHTTLPVIA